MKAQDPTRLLGEDPVEHQGVSEHVEVQGGAEPLDDHDRATPCITQALGALRTAAQEPEHGPHEDAHHGARQAMVPCQLVAQSVRKSQDPLAHPNDRQDMVDQMRRALRHASAPTARTDCAAFAREGDEQVLVAAITLETSEPAREEPAPEKALEFFFDKSGKASPVAGTGGLRAERLEVLAHGLREDTVGGRTRLVARGRTGHDPVAREPNAGTRTEAKRQQFCPSGWAAWAACCNFRDGGQRPGTHVL